MARGSKRSKNLRKKHHEGDYHSERKRDTQSRIWYFCVNKKKEGSKNRGTGTLEGGALKKGEGEEKPVPQTSQQWQDSVETLSQKKGMQERVSERALPHSPGGSGTAVRTK